MDYAEAEKLLHRGKTADGAVMDSRKLENNTYLIRQNVHWADKDGEHQTERGPIAVRLHTTDVVTFHRDGIIELDTGGWYTVTTKDRMNKYLPPPFKIFSERGTWHVALSYKTVHHAQPHPSYSWRNANHKYEYIPSGVDEWDSRELDESVPYFDGIQLDTLTNTVVNSERIPDEKAREKRNNETRRQIKRYVALYTDARVEELVEQAQQNGTGGDCWFCLIGPDYTDPDHLHSHMAEKYTMFTVMMNALKAKGYRDPVFVMSFAPDLVRRAISVYLRKRLLEATQVTQ
jgi:hypothetical protein